MARASGRDAAAGGLGCLIAGLLVLGLVAVGGFVWLRSRGAVAPVAPEPRCVARADGDSVVVDEKQAHLTAIIVGLSVRRGLPPRAGSIAMATVYQESGIRNLDYGDRDSVGLFQQRPSQGWGSIKQLMDPYYSTGRFYDALVKVRGWQSGDINDVAQAVQRSGYPEAYRDHERDGRILASVFAGHSEASLRCASSPGRAPDPAGLRRSLQKTLGVAKASTQDGALTVSTGGRELAWAAGYHAQANAAAFGVASVQVGERIWRVDRTQLTGWEPAPSVGASTVVIQFG